MMFARRRFVAAIAVISLLAAAGPVASAGAFPFGGADAVGNTGITPGACSTTRGPEGQASTGSAENSICQASGLAFIGPSVGQMATVIGPTIIGPAVVGTLIVSAGDAAGGP